MKEIRNMADEVVGHYNEPVEAFTELSEVREVTCGSLSVIVDFNDLFSDRGETEAFELIGKLKDLLA